MFGRRRKGAPAGQPAAVARGVVATVTPPTPATGYVQGWRGAGSGQAPWEQIGAYTGTALTMRAGNVLETQLRQGVESLSSAWFIPPSMVTPTGRPQTMANGALLGNQRIVGGSTGQLGPITARKMRAQVTAAAVRQSGLSAVQWAQSLSPQ